MVVRRRPLAEDVVQHTNVVVRCIAGVVEQRQPTTAAQIVEQAQQIRSLFELVAVLPTEVRPATRCVREPTLQRIAGRHFVQPQVGCHLLLAQAAGPAAVDENAQAVVDRRLLACTFHDHCVAPPVGAGSPFPAHAVKAVGVRRLHRGCHGYGLVVASARRPSIRTLPMVEADWMEISRRSAVSSSANLRAVRRVTLAARVLGRFGSHWI